MFAWGIPWRDSCVYVAEQVEGDVQEARLAGILGRGGAAEWAIIVLRRPRVQVFAVALSRLHTPIKETPGTRLGSFEATRSAT